MSAERTCQMCGRPIDIHDRDIRFAWPDPVLDACGGAPTSEVWMSHEDSLTSVMMQVDEVGAFVRVLVPVRLTGGYKVTFGAWLAVHPDDLQRAHRAWWAPDYPSLVLEGRLANNIPPWGLLGVEVRAEVLDPDHTPYCAASPDPAMSEVLGRAWPHGAVLDAVGG